MNQLPEMSRVVSHLDDGPPYRRLSTVIPVYNSEQTIGGLVDALLAELGPLYESVEIVLVNDGSADNSHHAALACAERHPGAVKYVQLARNFGEHNAVMCGLRHVTGDCVAIIDDDFQTPPGEIKRLTDKLNEGYDVVYSYYDDKRHHWFRNLGQSIQRLGGDQGAGQAERPLLVEFQGHERVHDRDSSAV